MTFLHDLFAKVGLVIASVLITAAGVFSPARPAQPVASSTPTLASSTSAVMSSSTASQTAVAPKKNVSVTPSVQQSVLPSKSASASPQGATSTSNSVPNQNVGLSPAAFVQILETVEQSALNNNPYLKEKTILLRRLTNGPLSQADIAQLSSDVQTVYNTGDIDAIELQIGALNQAATNYEIQTKQTYQTQINNYSLQNGLPITQLPPTETTCNWVGFGTVNCVTQ